MLNSNKQFPKIDSIFWWINTIFGMMCILFAGYFIYVTSIFFNEEMPGALLVVIVPTIILGPWILLDALYLNRIIKFQAYANRLSEIEDIKGSDMNV